MDDQLKEMAKVFASTLSMIEKSQEKNIDYKEQTAESLRAILKSIERLGEQASQARQKSIINQLLLSSLVEELIKSKALDGGAISARLLSYISKLALLFDKASLEHAKTVAEQMAHPLFPDELPHPLGLNPTLIVNNN
jgi:hypothetical protein